MSRQEQKLKDGAAQFLEPGEEIAVALVARPRGWTQAHAGSIHVGAHQQGKAYQGAEKAGFVLGSPMALAITNRRLMSIKIGSPIGLGLGGAVKELLSAVPLEQVDSIELERLALGHVITVTVNGEEFKLEVNAAADAKGLEEAFQQAGTG